MIRRFLRWLFSPDCDECGGYRPLKGLIGNYWHADACSRTRPVYPEGSDRE